MNSFSYLRSIKPKYGILIYLLFITFLIILISLFIFKSYDIYVTKGLVECEDLCKITIIEDSMKINKISNVNLIRINNNRLYPRNIDISEIMIDENSRSNYQIVTLEVDQLDNGILNTFQDVRLYSNEELIINKIIKVLL